MGKARATACQREFRPIRKQLHQRRRRGEGREATLGQHDTAGREIRQKSRDMHVSSFFIQVGESFFERNLNPAPEVDVSMEAAPGDVDAGKDAAISGAGEKEEGDSIDAGAADDGEGGARAELSDSMVPLVGDSVLQVKSELEDFCFEFLSPLIFRGAYRHQLIHLVKNKVSIPERPESSYRCFPRMPAL